jgi:hypothetical protein
MTAINYGDTQALTRLDSCHRGVMIGINDIGTDGLDERD